MKKTLGIVLVALAMLGLSTAAFAKGNPNGKGSNPQFPAPSPADYYVNVCTGAITIEWTAVTSNFTGQPPTKYAIEIVQTLRDVCPDGPVVGHQVNDFTAPGSTTDFTTPDGLLQIFAPPGVCDPSDLVILVKAINPPGKSQNNPQAVATFEAPGGGPCI